MEQDMINDNIERAWSFYDNEIYDSNYIADHNLFDETKEIYNPVPKIAFLMNALSLQRNLGVEGKENNSDVTAIEDFWDYNDFQTSKYMLGLWFILTRRATVELSKQEDGVIANIHDPQKVETKYIGGEMVYAKVTGTVEQFDMDTKEFKEVTVEKEWWNTEGYNWKQETWDGEVKEETTGPIGWDFIPIIEGKTDYNLWPIFNKVDNHNQLSAFLNAIFLIHGDPIIWDTLTGKQMDDKTKDKVKASRGKAMKMLHLGPEGAMGYLEMQGNVAKLMQEEKQAIEDNIANDYPEYVLAKILSEGDPSGKALEVKAVEIESKVNSLRSDFEEFVSRMNDMALTMMGKSPIPHNLKFGGILPTNLEVLVGMIEKLRGISLITKETAINKLQELIPNPDEEIKGLKEEEDESRKQIERELNSHVDTEDTE
jgi:hypothetical protein